jgi:hypothetical protein
MVSQGSRPGPTLRPQADTSSLEVFRTASLTRLKSSTTWGAVFE